MKSFVATDMRSALRMVREEFGEDAVILSNRRVPQGIELVAAADMPPAPPSTANAAESSAAPQEFAAIDRDAQRAARHSGDNGWWQMQQELRSMRDLIEQQYTNFSWQQYRTQQPAQAAMWRRLQRLGLDADIVRDLLTHDANMKKQIPAGKNANQIWQELMTRLSARIATCDNDLIEGGGIFAFVGPTGAGKTTTIGKLAARYVLDHGNTEVALVTTDGYRIGAHEQLRTLARILNVPCKIVSAQRDLATVLYELRHCKLVLIDTAGSNARAPELAQQLAALNALGERIRVIQVLAANSQHQALRNAQRAYHTNNLSACVLTKLDETASLGECISALVHRGLPLAYITDGQAIPGDIAMANSKFLVAQAIALAKHHEGSEEQVAEAFARAQSGASA